MTFCSLDFETYSECDLAKEGVWRYATHPSTEVVCMAYALDGEMQPIWLPHQPTPLCLSRAPAYRFKAWNAMFEYLIIKYTLGLDPGPLENWFCTMVKAQVLALPGTLEKCAEVLNMGEQKDKRGKYLINTLSKPRKGVRRRDPDLLLEFYDYCLQDVRTEMAIDAYLPDMTEAERQDWLLSELINSRGIPLDVTGCENATTLYERTKRNIWNDLFWMTQLDNPNSNAQMLQWLESNGYPMDSLSADAVTQALKDETI